VSADLTLSSFGCDKGTSTKLGWLLAINKPLGISSAQVVRDLQKAFNPSTLFAPWLEAERAKRSRENHNQRFRRKDKRQQVKIGHGGTLDPFATGVLVVGVGKGTKQLQGFLECTKAYEAIVLFGVATDTYDREGKVLGRAPYAHVTRASVEKALENFRGNIMQKPPLFSALRMQGKRLYEYARSGEDLPVEIQERPVEVKLLEIVEWFDGGTHQYKWPSKEVETESEAAVARSILPIVAVKEKSDGEVDVDDIPQQNVRSGTKRKRLSDREDDLVYEKKTRRDDPEMAMSGGLQSPGRDDKLGQPSTPEPAGRSEPGVPLTKIQRSETSGVTQGPSAVKLRMTVTSGFYVRSLCHDLGKAVGSLAIMSDLVRTRQGNFELGVNVLEYNELSQGEDIWGPKVEGFLDAWNTQRETSPAEEAEGVESGISVPAVAGSDSKVTKDDDG